MVTCPNGHVNPSNQRFCGDCGAPLEWSDAPAVHESDYRRFVIAAIGASVGIMVGSVGQWITAGMLGLNGLDAGKVGIAALTIGAASCVAMVLELFWPQTPFSPRWAVPVAWAAAVAGVTCFSYAVPFMIRIMALPKASFFGVTMGAEVGWGLWLLALSSAAMCATASIVATQIARSRDMQSSAAWTTGWRRAAIVTSAAVTMASVIYFSINWNGNIDGGEASPTAMASFPSFPSLTFPSFPSFSTNPEEPTTTLTTSETTTSTTAPVDPESASLQQLQQQARSDRPSVKADLADWWVPQLSSKHSTQPWTNDSEDGVEYDTVRTLQEHLRLRQQYPGVRLLWSGDWSTFSAPDFWVTVVGITFPESSGALAWCASQGLDSDHCAAKIVSTTHPVEGSTAYN